MYQFQLDFWNEFKKIFCYKTGLRKFVESHAKPWRKYDRLTDISVDELKDIICSENIKVLLLDMDGTVKHYKKGLISENKEWVDSLKESVKIYLMSNANKSLTSKVADELKVDYIHSAKKPLLKSYQYVAQMENCNPSEMIAIGDAILFDIKGAERFGIDKTILLKDLNILGLKSEYH